MAADKWQKSGKITPGNVGAVQWKLFSTVEAVQYGGGLASVLWGVSISTVEVAKYGRGLKSVQWRHCIEYSGFFQNSTFIALQQY